MVLIDTVYFLQIFENERGDKMENRSVPVPKPVKNVTRLGPFPARVSIYIGIGILIWTALNFLKIVSLSVGGIALLLVLCSLLSTLGFYKVNAEAYLYQAGQHIDIVLYNFFIGKIKNRKYAQNVFERMPRRNYE